MLMVAIGCTATLVGLVGCFVPVLPGPAIAYAALWILVALGIIFGPFLGTVVGELIAGKNLASSVRGGFGALVGFVFCLGLKLAAVGLYAWWYFARLPYSL